MKRFDGFLPGWGRMVSIFVAGLMLGWYVIHRTSAPTPKEVLADFYAAQGRAEDMLMDPLILHAGIVTPEVIKEVRNPDMDKRRYAIGFLGNEQVQEALPVLRDILMNPKEIDYFRSDALESIFQIDQKEGLERARQYMEQKNHLGHTAKGLLDRSHQPSRRTYGQAFIGYHE